MNFIRNILAIIGIIAIVGGGFAYSKFGSMAPQMSAFNNMQPETKEAMMANMDKFSALEPKTIQSMMGNIDKFAALDPIILESMMGNIDKFAALDPETVKSMMENMDSMMADMKVFDTFDPQAKEIYTDMWNKLKDTGNTAEATVWKYDLEEGVSPDDAEEAMKAVANEMNIKSVGDLPLSDQISAMTGEDHRKLKIFQFCNPLTAKKMVDYSDAFAAYLPCRVSMVEGKDGKVSLYALNMDMMIYGGKPLPEDLKKEAIEVKEVMLAIMTRGAAGDF